MWRINGLNHDHGLLKIHQESVLRHCDTLSLYFRNVFAITMNSSMEKINGPKANHEKEILDIRTWNLEIGTWNSGT